VSVSSTSSFSSSGLAGTTVAVRVARGGRVELFRAMAGVVAGVSLGAGDGAMTAGVSDGDGTGVTDSRAVSVGIGEADGVSAAVGAGEAITEGSMDPAGEGDSAGGAGVSLRAGCGVGD